MEQIKYKFDRRYNDIVLAGQRKNKKRTKRAKKLGVLNKFKAIVCVTILASTWYMCWDANQTVQTPKVEAASTEIVTNLDRDKGFISRDMPRYTDLYEKYFGDKADEARKIAKCESGNRDVKSKMNKNGTYDFGRMQVNSLWLKVYNLKESDLLQEEVNIATAKQIYDRTNNWNAWSSSRKCHGL